MENMVGSIVVVQTLSESVYAGKLASLAGMVAVLKDARRLGRLPKTFTLNELAKCGVGEDSELSEPVEVLYLSQAAEVIPCTKTDEGDFIAKSRTHSEVATCTSEDYFLRSTIGNFVVARTFSAGVHMGKLASLAGTVAVLKDARRLWRWTSAFTLNEVATCGVGEDSRISEPVKVIYLSQAIEVIPCTEKAEENLSRSRNGT